MKFWILLMTILSGALWLISACLTIWFLHEGAMWPGVLQGVATGLTFAGAQLGIWWIRHHWRE